MASRGRRAERVPVREDESHVGEVEMLVCAKRGARERERELESERDTPPHAHTGTNTQTHT